MTFQPKMADSTKNNLEEIKKETKTVYVRPSWKGYEKWLDSEGNPIHGLTKRGYPRKRPTPNAARRANGEKGRSRYMEKKKKEVEEIVKNVLGSQQNSSNDTAPTKTETEVEVEYSDKADDGDKDDQDQDEDGADYKIKSTTKKYFQMAKENSEILPWLLVAGIGALFYFNSRKSGNNTPNNDSTATTTNYSSGGQLQTDNNKKEEVSSFF